MKSLTDVLSTVVYDLGRQYNVSTTRDLETIARRSKDEGDSFVTITLPSLCLELDRALDEGRWSTPSKAFASKGSLPRFLGGFLDRVFEQDGTLRSDACIGCVAALRQILLLCKKVRRQASPKRLKAAQKAYVATDTEIDNDLPCHMLRDFKTIASILCTEMFGGFSIENARDFLVPRTGRGAVADRLLSNQKYSAMTWTERLNDVLPEDLFAQATPDANIDLPSDLTPPSEELPVRVVFVPKTLKTPRVIAIEPNCMQFAQQGVMQWFYDVIPRSDLLGKAIQFSDQEANRRRARLGSLDGRYSTIDLSEASDRVSLQLAREWFASCPDLWAVIDASRSRRALLPSGEILEIRKFASMGSALCFPVEALVFLTIVLIAGHRYCGTRSTRGSIKRLCRDILVYGDDIIVPVEWTQLVTDSLESFGLKVNRHKTFAGSNFRESCGGDYFRGEPVNPVYIREDFPTSEDDTTRFFSWVSTTNLLYNAGLWFTTQKLRDTWPLTTVKSFGHDKSAGAVWHTVTGMESHRGWDNNLHRFIDRRLVPSPVYQPDELEGMGALLKWFTKPDRLRKDHLTRSVRPGALSTKRRRVFV